MHKKRILKKDLDYGFEIMKKGSAITITETVEKNLEEKGYLESNDKNKKELVTNKKIKENGNK